MSSCCRSPSIRSAAHGATSRSACSRRPRATATPEGFARFVDALHAAGIGIILDWVPAHFPSDAHGLARFDGTALYEHLDPREGLPSGLEHADLQFRPPRGAGLPDRQRAALARAFPRRRPARRCGRLDALSRLQPQGRRMGAERAWRAREPGGGRIPAPSQRGSRRALPRRDGDRRGIDRLARRHAAGLRARPRLCLQVEHGLDARHAAVHRARPDPSRATTTTRSPSACSTPSRRNSSCRCRTTRSCTESIR